MTPPPPPPGAPRPPASGQSPEHAARVEAIFHEALERTPAEREAFVAKACAGDESLQQEVHRLLAAHEDAGTYFERPNPPEIEAELARLKPEEAGERIGRYKLLQEIGQGGFGTVWMAEQMEPVSRRVALKIIKMGMDTREVIGRFEQERQALAMMDHPNIAKVFDAGATPFGRPYFVMELVRGIPITEFCDERQLDTRQRLELFADVCAAINHAHQKGVIHRDIKPSNVMITLHGDKAVVKVIDFGIAKATQGKLTDKTLFTRFEQFIGTPVYMSPEQATLSGLDIDTRSDIYALGVLLYELLTGKPPFDAKSLVSAGYEEMRRIIREVEPPKPSTALQTMAAEARATVAQHRQSDGAKMARLLSGELDWIVMKALEKDRTRRYETANGFAEDIRRYLTNEPVTAAAPSVAYLFRKFARRHKAALGVAALIAVVLVAATGISVRQTQLARVAAADALQAKNDATAKADAAQTARMESEGMSNFLLEIFNHSGPEGDGRTMTVVQALDAAVKNLDRNSQQPVVRAKLRGALGLSYASLGLVEEAIPLQEKVRDYYLATYGAEHSDTLIAMFQLARSYSCVGREEEALRLREELLRLSRKMFGPEHKSTIGRMHDLASSYFATGRKEEALKLFEDFLRLSRKVNAPQDAESLWALRALADCYSDVGRPEESLKLLEEALPLSRKVLGPENPDTLSTMNCLAISYAAVGRQDEALALREEVLALSRKVLGPEDPETLGAMTNLAVSYGEVGRLNEGIELLEQSLTIKRRVLPPTHDYLSVALSQLANLYEEAGRMEEA